MIPGPAYCAAAVPVSTKMPAPMMAPIPMAMIESGPRDLDRLWASASPPATMSSTDLRAIRPVDSITIVPWSERARQHVLAGK